MSAQVEAEVWAIYNRLWKYWAKSKKISIDEAQDAAMSAILAMLSKCSEPNADYAFGALFLNNKQAHRNKLRRNEYYQLHYDSNDECIEMRTMVTQPVQEMRCEISSYLKKIDGLSERQCSVMKLAASEHTMDEICDRTGLTYRQVGEALKWGRRNISGYQRRKFTTVFPGVRQMSDSSYAARGTDGYKEVSLGLFKTAEEARDAVEAFKRGRDSRRVAGGGDCAG